jgi:hypothetical protein
MGASLRPAMPLAELLIGFKEYVNRSNCGNYPLAYLMHNLPGVGIAVPKLGLSILGGLVYRPSPSAFL